MKNNELVKIMKSLSLECYEKKGRLAYSVIEHESGAKILKGFYLDSSISKDYFFLQYFVQSLFDPFTNLNFSLGDRLGGHLKASDVDKANFLLDTFKDFERLNYFTDYIPFINSHPFYGSGINKLKCYAFHYYILSDISNSKKYFNKILEFETQQNSEWYEDDILIAKEFINYIDSKSFDKGICKLLQWQNDTIEQLKLDI